MVTAKTFETKKRMELEIKKQIKIKTVLNNLQLKISRKLKVIFFL